MNKPLTEDIEFLEHHGIKGMRWGVRKKEETSAPESKTTGLKNKVTTAKTAHQEKIAKDAEARAALLSNSITRLDNEIAVEQNPAIKNQLVSRKKWLEDQQATYLKEAKQAREGHLTDSQKHALKTAAVVGGVLAAYGVYRMAQSGELHQLKLNGESFIKGTQGLSWKRKDILADKNLTTDQIMSLVVNPINRGYGTPGTVMNCRRATFAYEMRRRGFDVAATKTTNGSGQDFNGLLNAIGDKSAMHRGAKTRAVGRVFKETYNKIADPLHAETPFIDAINGKRGPFKEIPGGRNGIFSTLSQQPNGARGELGVTWKQGGGHSLAWEIINGKPVIFDTQTRKKYESYADLDGLPAIGDSKFIRLDNLPLNDKFLRRWLKDA